LKRFWSYERSWYRYLKAIYHNVEGEEEMKRKKREKGAGRAPLVVGGRETGPSQNLPISFLSISFLY
jgi:hypothetical protein